MANKTFQFRSESSVVLCTPFRADSLRTMLDCLYRVDDSSVFYHLYYHLLRHPAFTSEHQNDFARWTNEAAGETVLAERLSIVDPLAFGSLATARARLIERIERHIGDLERIYRVAPGSEFRFMELRSFSFPIGISASDPAKFAEVLPHISTESVFYHYVAARLRVAEPMNDFSVWLRDAWDLPDLADEIESVTPYRCPLSGLAGRIAELVQRRIAA